MNWNRKNNRIDIKKLRENLNLTQEELAREVGVSLSTVSRWETERSRPSKLALQRLDDLVSTGRRE